MDKYDIIIIGAGAAGLTAGIYAARARKTVLVIEKTAAGGQILATTKVENYPGINSASGQEFGEKLKSQVKKFGGEFLAAEVLAVSKEDDIFRVETDEGFFYAGAVILANGSRERRLGLDDEEKFLGKGVSYCATCDGALYKNKIVAVYGGGNTAAYSVLYLAGIAEKVYWIFRKPEPRAEAHLVAKIREAGNIEIFDSTVIAELSGTDKLERLKFEDGSGLNLDGLFILIGREPNNEKFRELVKLDDEGYIDSDETCKTSEPGVFCAGDTRKKPLNQLITAAADGAVAATAAVAYLNR